MAIVVGSIVSMGVLGGALTATPVQPQPPKFGKVEALPGAADVLWEDGRLQDTITVTALDDIGEPAAAEVTRLKGQIVRVKLSGATNSDNAAYDALVVTLYTRDPGGAGPVGPTLALVRTIGDGGIYREIPAADLTVPAGR
jgi:hypothetical protein